MEKSPCARCQTAASAFMCFCQRVFLCAGCLSFHLLDNPLVRHNPVSLQDDLSQLGERTGERRRGVESGERARVREALKNELTRLQQFKALAFEQLQQVRSLWLSEINRATSEIEDLLKSKCDALTQKILQCLTDLDDSPSPFADQSLSVLAKQRETSLLDLSFDLREVDLNTLIKQFVNISLGFKQTEPEDASLYKFFGGQASVCSFSPGAEKITNTFRSAEKFLHNSSWVVSPSGLVYVTGGSLMGKSKDEVLLFDPKDEKTEVLPAMIRPRRSHTTVFLGNKLYVFGGMHEEHKLDACESLSVDSQAWQECSDMTYPRAYLGSAVYNEEIYLAGGCESSGVELFHPTSNYFEFIQLETCSLAEACSMVALDDSIVILHGNYQGEVLHFFPSTHSIQRVCDMCHGNSWSNCPPLIYKDVIYTIRSDSVLKFEMKTYKSSYVLWMAKSGKKRRGTEDN